MAIREDGKTYIVDISFKKLDGKYGRKRVKGIKTKSEAKKIEAELLKELSENTNQDILVSAAINEFLVYKKNRIKQSSYDRYVAHFKTIEHIKCRKIKDITPQFILRLQNDLIKQNKSNSYINNVLFTISSLFNFCKMFYGTINNPTDKIKKLTVTKNNKLKFYSFEEWKVFISNVDIFEYKVLFSLLYFTGIRYGELRALNWLNIDLENQKINIEHNMYYNHSRKIITPPKTKGSKRAVAIDDDLTGLLKKHKEVQKKYNFFKENDLVFESSNIAMSHSQVLRILKKYAEKSNLENIGLHGFRHSHASLLINNNINILAISKRLGHDDVKMTLNVYSHMFEETEKEVINLLNNLK